MFYLLSTIKNSFGLVEYDHKNSIDYFRFQQCARLKDAANEVPIVYNVLKKSAIQRLSKFHIVESTGPTLVSHAFRKVIEEVSPSDVEFIDVSIRFEDQEIEGFSCIHPLVSVDCMDMQRSEYEKINFDPIYPVYSFVYMCLLENVDINASIMRASEYPRGLVVDDNIKNACCAAKLKGLVFYSALDMTYNNRTVSEKI